MHVKFPYEHKTSGTFGSIPTVSFWLHIISPIGPIPFYFLFDTGADVTSLPASAAEKLGIDLDHCPKEPMSGYEGTEVFVYRSQITLQFNKQTYQVPCVFHPNEDVPLLLGRAGILDRFTIIFDAKKKEVAFEQISQ